MKSEATDAAQHARTKETRSPFRIPVRTLLAAVAGAALMYFLDPERGRSRWTLLRDRTAGTVRHLSRHVERAGRRAIADVYGVRQKVTHLRPEETEAPNDPDLVQRVETELFRDPDIPKGAININAENGKVILRGQLERPEMIHAIERKVRKVHGVQEVENLMHLPGTPAPNKEAALCASHEAAPVAP